MYAPWDLRIRRILEPVTDLTCAIPLESRSITPICEGVIPFFAILVIWSITVGAVALSHEGADLLYGLAEREIPFLYTFTQCDAARRSNIRQRLGIIEKVLARKLSETQYTPFSTPHPESA